MLPSHHLQVVKPYSESPATLKGPMSEATQNAVNSVSSQITPWDGKQEYQGPRRQHLPSSRAYCPGRTNHSTAPGSQPCRGPHQNRTKAPGQSAGGVLQRPSNTVTMVTATASVTVAVHPSLPGSYQGYMHEGFEDSELDSFEEMKRTSQSFGKATQSFKTESLELQDLESVEKNQNEANKAL